MEWLLVGLIVGLIVGVVIGRLSSAQPVYRYMGDVTVSKNDRSKFWVSGDDKYSSTFAFREPDDTDA